MGCYWGCIGRAPMSELYMICVIIAHIYADYSLSTFVEYLIVFLSPSQAAAAINVRDGVAGIFGVVGAIVVDLYLTPYGMIFFSSLIYATGLSLIAVDDRSTDFSSNSVLVLTGLFLSGVAQFSLKNSSNALNEERTVANQRSNNCLTNGMKFIFGNDNEILKYVRSHGRVIILVLVKYVTKIGFIIISTALDAIYGDTNAADVYYLNVVYWIPVAGLGFVIIVSLLYVKSFVKPLEHRGTPLENVLRVYVAAIKKRNLHPENRPSELLHEGNSGHPLNRINRLRFLDKAAISESNQPDEERRRWRFCTPIEVEETKRLLRMLPMCMTFLAYGIVKSLGNTFFLIQGNRMDATISGSTIEIPLQTLIILGEISGLGTKGLYAFLISKRLTGTAKKYGPPIQYTIGIVLATFCCTVASWIATDKTGNQSVFWLTPQFILFGSMTEVTQEGITGFFRGQLPPSMVRYYSVFTDAMIGAGAILSAVFVLATDSLPLNSNKGLGIFYRLPTVVCFVILSAYTFIATRYQYHGDEEARMVTEN